MTNTCQNSLSWKVELERSWKVKKEISKLRNRNIIFLRTIRIIKSTLMEIWKSSYMFVFISKQYPENFVFLILRILKLLAHEVCNFLKSTLIFKNFFHISQVAISQKVKGVFNVKSTTYHFHMKTKILTDFQYYYIIKIIIPFIISTITTLRYFRWGFFNTPLF